METEEVIELAENPSCLAEQQREDIATTVPDDPKRSIESPRTQEKERRENARETARKEKLRGNRLERGRKSVDRKQHCNVDWDATETEKCGGSWWKDGGQTILQFFAKILGKRGGMTAKGATDRASPNGNKRHSDTEHVKRVSRGDRSRNARARVGVDAGTHLKRVSNGYIASHVYRYSQDNSGSVSRRELSGTRGEFVLEDGHC